MSKTQKYITIFIQIIIIFPFFALLFFVFPQSDDYFFAVKIQELGVFEFVKDMYFNWSGRYFSMFLGAIDPFTINSILLYRLSIFLIHISVIITLYKLLRTIIKKSVSRLYIIIFTLLFHIIFLNGVIDIYELLYWYPSVSSYTLGFPLFLILITLYLKKQLNKIRNIYYVTFTSITTLILIGLHELFIIPTVLFFLITLVNNYYNKREYKFGIPSLLSAIISSSIVILAPGNYTRANLIDNSFNILSTLYLIIKGSILIIVYFFQNPVFIIGSILFSTIIYTLNKENKFTISIPIIKPYFVIGAFVIIIISLFLPFNLFLNHLPSGRIFNLVSFFFLIIWFIGIALIINYYKDKINLIIPKTYTIILYLLIILFSFSGVIIIDKPNLSTKPKDSIYLNGNILYSYYVLIFEAKNFKDDFIKRRQSFTIQEVNNESLIVKPLKTHPKILIFADLNKIHEPQKHLFYWEAKYYGKDSVIYKK